jgi:muramoyltetrapeptide carboxypeptidase LdcA involved in peptidoglycan recycling
MFVRPPRLKHGDTVAVVSTSWGGPHAFPRIFEAGVPIVTNMDFGHTDPQWILPLGVEAELDPASNTFRLLEPAVD